jgi:hypothetical protein
VQRTSHHAFLEEERAEVLRLGTLVDINRVEGDDLTLTPNVNPEDLRGKVTKTGDLEAVLFMRLFEVSDRAEALLSPEQRTILQRLRHHQIITAGNRHDYAHGTPHQRQATGPARFDFFLDQ